MTSHLEDSQSSFLRHFARVDDPAHIVQRQVSPARGVLQDLPGWKFTLMVLALLTETVERKLVSV